MKYVWSWPIAAALAFSAPSAAEQPAPPSQQLDAAWNDFQAALAESTTYLRQHPFYRDDENRASAYAFLTSMMLARIEENVVFDPDFPHFRVLDHRIREGGDNPDQRYLIANIRGGTGYRVWGKLGKQRRLEFQVYAGDPYVAGSGGRSVGSIGADQMKFGPDGAFEVWITPDKRPGNWIENPPDGSQLLVRQVVSDWDREMVGDVHVDRIGHEGDLKPVVDDAMMAARLHKAAADLRTHVRVWPGLIANRYMKRTPNTVGVPFDPGSQGGLPGRFMASGQFDLAPDEALIIRTWPASGNYQGIQLTDLWFSSLEYSNRQTSLSGDQARRSVDGSYYFVLAGSDPGIPNWLDTMGRRHGVFLLRFDGMKEKVFDPAKYPVATKVKLAELASALPKDMPRITPQQRARAIAARRRHVQLRYND
ncbi:hypothetical protein [Novosphingobium sp.]|uniref:hypothetical protein n=1 Tax=Novosphingobium sp. TaxID=1874826 RepID=UPI0035B02454